MRKLLLVTLVLLTAAGCATKKDVQEIVATSNAAMVDIPYLPQADGTVDEAQLDEAIKRMEKIIEANPEQTVLINTLRVRQAMLLLVHEQPEAAKIVWDKASRPPGERDGALYDLRNELVWWFPAARNFKDDDIDEGKKALEKFQIVCDELTLGSGTRNYLETMRASIGLMTANKENTFLNDEARRKEAKQEVSAFMVDALERLAAQFDPTTDGVWVTNNWDGNDTLSDVPISVVRARAELRSLIKEYFKVAKRKNLEEFSAIVWRPQWVQELWLTWNARNAYHFGIDTQVMHSSGAPAISMLEIFRVRHTAVYFQPLHSTGHN